MSNKTIIISHGDKGGCGKSHVAMITAAALSQSNEPMLLIDADANASNMGQGDVANRFKTDLHRHVETVVLPLTGEDGDAEQRVGDMLDFVTDFHGSVVLINLPANASQTLEAQGELLAEMVAEFGHQLFILYSFEPLSVSVSGLIESAESAVMSAAERVVLVRNENFGSEATYNEVISAHPSLASFPQATIPVLSERAIQALKNNPDADLSALANDANRETRWTLRKTLSGYQRRAAQALFDALGLHIIESQSDEARPSIDEVF